MKVEKWGDDLAIRLSAEVVEFLDLKDGDEVDIWVSGPDTFDIAKRGGCSGRSVRAERRVHQRHPIQGRDPCTWQRALRSNNKRDDSAGRTRSERRG